MSPAAHAVVGAVIAVRSPRLAVALPLAFLSHFLFDALPHFESFDGLAEALGTSKETAFWTAAAVLGGGIGSALLWTARKHRDLLMFVAAASTVSIAMRIPGWEMKVVTSVALAALFLALTRSRHALTWTLGAAAATSPDVIKYLNGAFAAFHGSVHFSRGPGYWLHRILGPGGDVFAWERFSEPWFLVGSVFEVGIESLILIVGVRRLAAYLERSEGSDDHSPEALPASLRNSRGMDASPASSR